MEKQNQAFTLVELIVVIIILAILGTIAFISLQGYSAQARDTTRISDINNIKKSLELFSLNTGKYPTPDIGFGVTYKTDVVWTQGVVGDNVTINLSRNLNSKPTDPLTETEYTYSVIGSQTQYELLSVYESDLISYNYIPLSGILSPGQEKEATSLVSQTNAANQAYPKIDGTYNGVFVKTSNYYIPSPSIVNSELNGIDLELTSDTIKSQIITGGENNIANGTNEAITDGLSGFTLQAFSGIISDKNDDNKEDLANALITAYSGTTLANEGIYKKIATTDSSDSVELISLVDDIVLSSSTYVSTSLGDENVLNLYPSCTGINTPTPFSATTTYLQGTPDECNIADTIVCIGDGIGYTLAGCNVGATKGSEYDLCVDSSSCTTERVGNYYQFGKNDTSFVLGDSGHGNDWKIDTWIDGIDDGSANLWGVFEDDKTTTRYNNPLGNTDIGLMQGLCTEGYHVPTNAEWIELYTAGDWVNSGGNIGDNMKSDLKIPKAGFRSGSGGGMLAQGDQGYLWSSSPNSTRSYNILFHSTSINPSDSIYRDYAFPIRCFKN